MKFIRCELVGLKMKGNKCYMRHVHGLESHTFRGDFEGDLTDYIFDRVDYFFQDLTIRQLTRKHYKVYKLIDYYNANFSQINDVFN